MDLRLLALSFVALLLWGCENNSPEADYPLRNPVDNVIRSRVELAPGQQIDKVEVAMDVRETEQDRNLIYPVIASSEVRDGRFELKLPMTLPEPTSFWTYRKASDYYGKADCSAPGAIAAYLIFTAYYQEKHVGRLEVINPNDPDVYGSYCYVSEDVEIVGSHTEPPARPSLPTTYEYALSFKRGYNLCVFRETGDGTSGITSHNSSQIPEGMKFRFVPAMYGE